MSAALRWMPVFVGLALICVAATAQPPTRSAGSVPFDQSVGDQPAGSNVGSAAAGNRNFPSPSFSRNVRASHEISPPVAAPSPSGKLQLVSQLVEGGQQVVVLDSQTRALAVYRIDPKTGEIGLQSVRRIEWDLKMEQFNGSAPSPEHIQSLLMPANR